MKASSIEIGGIYHDGKLGVREIVAIDGAPGCGDTRITYRILAAKVEQEYSHAKKAMVSLIGVTSKCDLASLAAWAKDKVPLDEKDMLLATLAATKLRLPPGEAAFMASVAKEFDDEFPIKTGVSVSFKFNETRQARGIEKKGLATVGMAAPGAGGGEIVLTELGAAWLRAHRAAAAPRHAVNATA